MNEDCAIVDIISNFFTVLSNSNDQSNTQDGEQQINDDDIDQEIVATTSQCVATSKATIAASSSRPASSLSLGLIASTSSSGTGSRPPSRVKHLSRSSDSGPSKRSKQSVGVQIGRASCREECRSRW